MSVPPILLVSTAPPGNDAALVEAHVRARGDLRAGDIAVLRVLHDEWCAHWRSQPCNCQPDVEGGPPIRTRQQRRQAEREQRKQERGRR